jgi:hypothetical protein
VYSPLDAIWAPATKHNSFHISAPIVHAVGTYISDALASTDLVAVK